MMGRGADALATARDLSGYLTHLMVGALCVALLVAAFVQFLAPLSAAVGQRMGVQAWIRRAHRSMRPVFVQPDGRPDGSDGRHPVPGWLRLALEEVHPADDQLLADAVARVEQGRAEISDVASRARWWLLAAFAGPGRDARSLGSLRRVGSADASFMFAVQGDLRAAVAAPVARMPLFLLATAGMSHHREVMPLVITDLLATRRPDVALQLASPAGDPGDGRHVRPGLAAASGALAALDDAAARTAERNLDDLQRSLARFGAWASRALAIALGLTAALVAQWLLGVGPDPTALSVGVSGGVLAILLRDGLAALAAYSAR